MKVYKSAIKKKINYKGGGEVLYEAEISWNREMEFFPNKAEGSGASRPVYIDSRST